MSVADDLLPVYVGTYRRPGHYVWTSDGRSHYGEDQVGKLHDLDDDKWCGSRTVEGAAKVTHLGNAFTVLGFQNRTDDSRPGSHAVFCFRGVMAFDEVVAAAREAFPWVWEHFAFEVTHVETVSNRPAATLAPRDRIREGDIARSALRNIIGEAAAALEPFEQCPGEDDGIPHTWEDEEPSSCVTCGRSREAYLNGDPEPDDPWTPSDGDAVRPKGGRIEYRVLAIFAKTPTEAPTVRLGYHGAYFDVPLEQFRSAWEPVPAEPIARIRAALQREVEAHRSVAVNAPLDSRQEAVATAYSKAFEFAVRTSMGDRDVERFADAHVDDDAVTRALSAQQRYRREQEDARREESIRLWGHPGAYVPSATVDQREAMRRALAAAGAAGVPGDVERFADDMGALRPNLNDTFDYACADTEEIVPCDELVAFWRRHGWIAFVALAAWRRRRDPIPPVAEKPEYRAALAEVEADEELQACLELDRVSEYAAHLDALRRAAHVRDLRRRTERIAHLRREQAIRELPLAGGRAPEIPVHARSPRSYP